MRASLSRFAESVLYDGAPTGAPPRRAPLSAGAGSPHASPPPEELAALLAKLKKRSDALERRSASLTAALQLSLSLIADTSAVIEALTGAPLGSFTEPAPPPEGAAAAATGAASPAAVAAAAAPLQQQRTPGSGVPAGDPLLDTIGAGMEAVGGLVKRAAVAAAAAAANGVARSSSGLPPAPATPALVAPFPGRILRQGALHMALVAGGAAVAAAAVEADLPPVTDHASEGDAGEGGGSGGSHGGRLRAVIASQGAQLRIMTAELAAAQRGRTHAAEEMGDALAAANTAQEVATREAEAAREDVARLTSALASAEAAAVAAIAARDAITEECAALRRGAEDLAEELEGVRLSVGVCNHAREEDALAAAAAARAAAASMEASGAEVIRLRGEVDRASARAAHAETLAGVQADRLAGEVARLKGELDVARASAIRLRAERKQQQQAYQQQHLQQSPPLDPSTSAFSLGDAGGGDASAVAASDALAPAPVPAAAEATALRAALARAEAELTSSASDCEDALTLVSLARAQEAVLKAEVRAASARADALMACAGGVHWAYLRSVVEQIGTCTLVGGGAGPPLLSGPPAGQVRALLDVLATMLDFDAGERARTGVPPPKRSTVGGAGSSSESGAVGAAHAALSAAASPRAGRRGAAPLTPGSPSGSSARPATAAALSSASASSPPPRAPAAAATTAAVTAEAANDGSFGGYLGMLTSILFTPPPPTPAPFASPRRAGAATGSTSGGSSSSVSSGPWQVPPQGAGWLTRGPDVQKPAAIVATPGGSFFNLI